MERWQVLHPPLMVWEAPGGLERVATAAVAPAGLPVVVVPPRQARDGARAPGQLATPDAVEARALAPGADVMRPTPRPLPDAPTQARRARLGRRQPLIGMRPAAPHRLAGTRERLPTALKAPSTGRNARLGTRDDAIETLRRARPLWREHEDWLQRAPGLGPVCARPLWLARPEVGTLHRQQSAAVVGVAPLHGARGTLRGRRTLWGGRAHGRTVWSLGPRVATRDNPRLTPFDARLLAAGKGKKVALTAWRQKFLPILNAMRKPRTPWHAQEVQG